MIWLKINLFPALTLEVQNRHLKVPTVLEFEAETRRQHV